MPDTLLVNVLGQSLYVDTQDKGGSQWLRNGISPEPHVTLCIERCLKPGGVFVDGGAHIGWHSIKASQVAGPTGRVFSFEPSPRTYAVLQKNTRENMQIFNGGLWSGSGTGVLHLHNSKSGLNSLCPANQGGGSTQIPLLALDDVLPVLPDMIKLDVEGAEVQALKGMERVIRESVNLVVVVECYPKLLDSMGDGSEQLLEVLRRSFDAVGIIGKDYIKDSSVGEVSNLNRTRVDLLCWKGDDPRKQRRN